MPFLIGLVLPLEPQKPTFPSLPCLVMGARAREVEEEITLWMIFTASLTVEVTLLLGLLDNAASDIRPRQSSV